MMGAMDNLVKGAAGQAVQNMNLMFGFDEAKDFIRFRCTVKEIEQHGDRTLRKMLLIWQPERRYII